MHFTALHWEQHTRVSIWKYQDTNTKTVGWDDSCDSRAWIGENTFEVFGFLKIAILF